MTSRANLGLYGPVLDSERDKFSESEPIKVAAKTDWLRERPKRSGKQFFRGSFRSQASDQNAIRLSL